MKLMMVVLRNDDADEIIQELIDNDFRVTIVASTGGFLRKGNTTLFVGTEGARIEKALEIIQETSVVPLEQGHRRATVFVLDVDRYTQL